MHSNNFIVDDSQSGNQQRNILIANENFQSNLLKANNKPEVNNKQIAIAAFFNQNYGSNMKQQVEVLFPDMILSEKFALFSSEIKSRRNILIYLTIFQVLASLLGMLYMIIRRSYVYLVINLLTILLAFCGLFGSIRMHYLALIIHCLFTVSLTGGFFFYQFIDFFLTSESSDIQKKRVSDSLILFIFSVPYLYDFICGLYCYFFLKAITKENASVKDNHQKLKEEIDEINTKVPYDKIEKHIKNVDNEICIICMVNKRNAALTPCGHYLCCNDCANELFSKYIFARPRCPICRRVCESFVKIIIS